MNLFAYIVMIGWLPAVFVLSAVTRIRHRAIILVYMVAWLFLPAVGFSVPGIPDYDKMLATGLGALGAALVLDFSRFLDFRPRWFDLPVAVLCLTPFVTSIANGLGGYDGLSAAFEMTVRWGVPYLLGRLYLANPAALRDLAWALVIGGLIYAPLCVIEMRVSAQLHTWVYGVETLPAIHFGRAELFGPFGWKPIVFMTGAFALSMFMASATISAFWLWWTGQGRHLWHIPMGLIVAVLFVVTLGCKVWTGAILMVGGMAILLASDLCARRVFLAGLVLVPPLYMAVRVPELWHGEPVQTLAGSVWERKAETFQVRLDNEDMLIDKALRRPWLGWGRWGRSRVYDERGKDISLTDGQWVITLGQYGLVGLVSLTVAMLMPLVVFIRRFPARYWRHPSVAPVAVLGLLLGLHMVDNLLNAFPNPAFPMIAGALAPLRPQWRTARARRKRSADAKPRQPACRPGAPRPAQPPA